MSGGRREWRVQAPRRGENEAVAAAVMEMVAPFHQRVGQMWAPTSRRAVGALSSPSWKEKSLHVPQAGAQPRSFTAKGAVPRHRNSVGVYSRSDRRALSPRRHRPIAFPRPTASRDGAADGGRWRDVMMSATNATDLHACQLSARLLDVHTAFPDAPTDVFCYMLAARGGRC